MAFLSRNYTHGFRFGSSIIFDHLDMAQYWVPFFPMEGSVELTRFFRFFPLRTLEATLKAPESIAPSMAAADRD